MAGGVGVGGICPFSPLSCTSTSLTLGPGRGLRPAVVLALVLAPGRCPGPGLLPGSWPLLVLVLALFLPAPLARVPAPGLGPGRDPGLGVWGTLAVPPRPTVVPGDQVLSTSPPVGRDPWGGGGFLLWQGAHGSPKATGRTRAGAGGRRVAGPRTKDTPSATIGSTVWVEVSDGGSGPRCTHDVWRVLSEAAARWTDGSPGCGRGAHGCPRVAECPQPWPRVRWAVGPPLS